MGPKLAPYVEHRGRMGVGEGAVGGIVAEDDVVDVVEDGEEHHMHRLALAQETVFDPPSDTLGDVCCENVLQSCYSSFGGG